MNKQPGVTVIVIPQPTVNGPLHVGHLSGPYLAADIASRAAKRLRGDRIVTLAGVVVHPNDVMTNAENHRVDVNEIVAGFNAQITTAFELAGIGYDAFLDPEEDDFQRAVTGMLAELIAAGSISMREVTLHACADCGRTMHHSYVVGKCPICGAGANGLSCEPCGGFTSSELLVDASCARCGGSLRPMPVTVPVLPLEDYRAHLLAEWEQGRAAPAGCARRFGPLPGQRAAARLPRRLPDQLGDRVRRRAVRTARRLPHRARPELPVRPGQAP